jgi:hypothetical protein
LRRPQNFRTRHRRVRRASPTLLPDSVRCDRDEATDLALGHCDLGLGGPELGYISLTELRAVRDKLELTIKRDLHFETDKSISAYADEARTRGHIVK